MTGGISPLYPRCATLRVLPLWAPSTSFTQHKLEMNALKIPAGAQST